MKDRIKLAEAMGWTYTPPNTSGLLDITHPEEWTHPDHKYGRSYPPNPFTDANYDYACLQFLKEKRSNAGKGYKRIGESYFYQVGDWARSLLKEIEND